jgi:hypothetical protein
MRKYQLISIRATCPPIELTNISTNPGKVQNPKIALRNPLFVHPKLAKCRGEGACRMIFLVES